MAHIAAIDLYQGANPAVLPLAVIASKALKGVMAAEIATEASDAAADPAMLMAAVARQRDRGAFMKLFKHFAPRLKAYLMRLGSDSSVAEDLVQDVMLTVWHRAHQFDRSKAGVSTWIFTIARNRRIDGLRRERRPEIDPEDPMLVREPEEPADRRIEASERQKRLHAAMADLPAEQGSLLKLAYYDDKSHSEIAADLGLPLGTVKSRLRLAVGKLRAALGDME